MRIVLANLTSAGLHLTALALVWWLERNLEEYAGFAGREPQSSWLSRRQF